MVHRLILSCSSLRWWGIWYLLRNKNSPPAFSTGFPFPPSLPNTHIITRKVHHSRFERFSRFDFPRLRRVQKEFRRVCSPEIGSSKKVFFIKKTKYERSSECFSHIGDKFLAICIANSNSSLAEPGGRRIWFGGIYHGFKRSTVVGCRANCGGDRSRCGNGRVWFAKDIN